MVGITARAEAILATIKAIRSLLLSIDPNLDKECQKNTPERYVNALLEMASGYEQDPTHILSKTFPLPPNHDQIILVSNIPFTSTCAHHLMPFHGMAHIAYVPQEGEDGKVVGLSKIPRLVECYSQRLQMQELLGVQIADAINTSSPIKPLGVAVVITSQHDCMVCRGVRSTGLMTTSVLRGVFKDDNKAREELFLLLGQCRKG